MNTIGEINQYLCRAEDSRNDSGRLAHILSEMEVKYSIPVLASELVKWKKDNQDAEIILRAYRYISSLRDDLK